MATFFTRKYHKRSFNYLDKRAVICQPFCVNHFVYMGNTHHHSNHKSIRNKMGDIVKITFDVYCQRSLIARFDKLKQIFTEDCIRRSSCRDYCIKIHGPDQNQPPSSEDYVLQLERARKEKYLYRATESKQ